ncbi:MAG: glycine zipper 2TM domain-containing protein [Phenylobacterium sp.]|uniref:glycine zipper 2TM domain-containing protein n=1 Tax=Phenylobacterium sp. TaxID=1871053 RepID=UPI0025FC289E|nr:glycine zipper 2TM domain-containing protein [Phenylobacterium sp.]MBI1199444.1 glycine zipper 2TM domain-containing protein [Phenylobacterium sp.]
MRKFAVAAVAAAAALTALPAAADPPPWAPAHGYRHKAAHRYDDRGRYVQPVVISRSDRVWRGNDGRYYCRRDNGTTGLVIGAAVGALAGRELSRGGDRTLGTIVGAVGGGLLGKAIDSGDLKCR